MTIVQTLLDQPNNEEILLIGCQSLFVFVNNQVTCCFFCNFDFLLSSSSLIKSNSTRFPSPQNDGTYMFTLDGFIPRLCELAQEIGEDEKVHPLRAAGLQALSAMVLSLVFPCLLDSRFSFLYSCCKN